MVLGFSVCDFSWLVQFSSPAPRFSDNVSYACIPKSRNSVRELNLKLIVWGLTCHSSDDFFLLLGSFGISSWNILDDDSRVAGYETQLWGDQLPRGSEQALGSLPDLEKTVFFSPAGER